MDFRKIGMMVCAVSIAACQASTSPSSITDDAATPSEKIAAETAKPSADHADELSSHKNESMAELDAFVEGSTKILTSQQGDLQGGGERGVVLVLDRPGAGNGKLGEGGPRTVLLLTRDGAGKLQKAGKNDRLIPCAQCGGLAGDPFGYIQVGNGGFTILTEGGSRERWSNEYTFKYSTGQHDWLLDRTVRTVTDTGTGEEKRVELTSKDFGMIRFEEFDPKTLPAAAENQRGGNAVLRDSYYKCAETTEGETWAIQDCIEEEYEYQDARLNKAYQKLLDGLSVDKRNEFRTAQRKWLVERDQCAGDEQDEGQAQRLMANHCFLEFTAKRADELEAMRK